MFDEEGRINDNEAKGDEVKIYEPLNQMIKHYFLREMSLQAENMPNGIILACDNDDMQEIYKTLFNAIEIPRVACYHPAIAAMYSNSRSLFGLVLNIGDKRT